MGTRQYTVSLRLVTAQNPMKQFCRLFKLTLFMKNSTQAIVRGDTLEVKTFSPPQKNPMGL